MSITWTRETGAEVFYAALVDQEGSDFRLSFARTADMAKSLKRPVVVSDEVARRANFTPPISACMSSAASPRPGGYGQWRSGDALKRAQAMGRHNGFSRRACLMLERSLQFHHWHAGPRR